MLPHTHLQARSDAPAIFCDIATGVRDVTRNENGLWVRGSLDRVLYANRIPGMFRAPGSWWKVPQDVAEVLGLEALTSVGAEPSGLALNIPLRGYQDAIVKWALARRGVLIADAMRLGKTIESLAIAYASTVCEGAWTGGQVIGVVPSTKLWDWAEEAARVVPEPYGTSSIILRGRDADAYKAKRWWDPHAWLYLVNYEILHDWLATLLNLPQPSVVILDECVAVKSRKSQRFRAAAALCDRVRDAGGVILGLSGEPIENRPWDLWGQLRCIRGEHEFGTLSEYHNRYCGRSLLAGVIDPQSGLERTIVIEPGFEGTWGQLRCNPGFEGEVLWKGYDRNASSNEEELAARLRSVMVRRRKDSPEVAAQMPRVVPQVLRTDDRSVQAAAAQCAVDATRDGSKALLFAYYKETARVVHEAILREQREREVQDPVLVLTGDVTAARRDALLRETRVRSGACTAIATIDAMGMGVDFSHFDNAIFVELHHTPAKVLQAMERLWTVDRTRSYGIFLVVARGTREERIAELLEDKLRQSDAITGRTTESKMLQGIVGDAYGSKGEGVMSDLYQRLLAIEQGGEV